MATASSVQREPSMEEILASIRRIIEDSDGGRRPVGDDSEPDAEEDPAEAGASAAEATGEVEVFRSELRAGSIDPFPREPELPPALQDEVDDGEHAPAASVTGDVATMRPVSLAELGARVAAADEFGAAATQTHMPADASKAEPTGRSANQSDPLDAPHDAGAASFDEPQLEIDDSDLILDDAEEEAPADTSASRPALVSEETSRQVAAAFGELSEAFASRSKKSFDEMAEEMLRPMLQEWLDNNLPTLVERLVREEIERVARGAS